MDTEKAPGAEVVGDYGIGILQKPSNLFWAENRRPLLTAGASPGFHLRLFSGCEESCPPFRGDTGQAPPQDSSSRQSFLGKH